MSTLVDPLVLLAAASYPMPPAAPGSLNHALSTGRALLGIAGTAMGALDALRAGVHPGFVVTPLARSSYT
jgi:hypothetical protein